MSANWAQGQMNRMRPSFAPRIMPTEQELNINIPEIETRIPGFDPRLDPLQPAGQPQQIDPVPMPEVQPPMRSVLRRDISGPAPEMPDEPMQPNQPSRALFGKDFGAEDHIRQIIRSRGRY